MSKDVAQRGAAGTVGRRTDLERFEQMILDQLADAGLPNEDVFVSVTERRRMLGNVGDAIGRLSSEQRAGSRYVSKMIAAAAAGLFDAALNYLWDETVGELRRRVAGFDRALLDAVRKSPETRGSSGSTPRSRRWRRAPHAGAPFGARIVDGAGDGG